MAKPDDEDSKYRRIVGHLDHLDSPKRLMLPWTEEELYRRAFNDPHGTFPLDLLGDPIASDSVFEGGAQLAAMALLGVALTENLSDASLATIRQIYDALNPDAERGEYIAKVRQRQPGRSRPSVKAELRQQLDDATTAKLVEFAERRFGKKEAAISYIAELKGVSRANIFRALARHRKAIEEKSQ